MAVEFCDEEGCPSEAKRGGKCWTHTKRKRKGQRLDTPIDRSKSRVRPLSPTERLTEAALTYSDAGDKAAFEAAKKKLQRAAAHLGTLMLIRKGWKPPRRS